MVGTQYNSMNKQLTCCICGQVILDKGCNPRGAMMYKDGQLVTIPSKKGDRCCNICDYFYVTPGRMWIASERFKNNGPR